MDTTCTERILREASEHVVVPNVPPVNTNSTHEVVNQNRLIHYIRSMPFVSLLFGRNVPPGSLPNEQNRSFIFKCLMIFHLIILVTLIGLTTFTIYYYNIRFYKIQTRPSETLIVCWLLRGIWHTINSSWSLNYYLSNVVHRSNLKLSQISYNIASILWISLTVVFLGVSPREDLKSPSARICYFLLWITFASYVVPMLAYTVICILLYITLLLVIFFRHGSLSLTLFGVPAQLLKKLKVERYKDVLKRIELGHLDLSDIYEMKNKHNHNDVENNHDNNESNNHEIHMDSPLAVNSIKGGFNDCVDNCEMLNERLCSICILNIKDDDKVYLLPCDIRHLFHRNCLNKWFKRSSECPICRTNITNILSENGGEQPPQPEVTNDTEINTQNEFSDSSMIRLVIENSFYEDVLEEIPELQNEMITKKYSIEDYCNNRFNEDREFYYSHQVSDVIYLSSGIIKSMFSLEDIRDPTNEHIDLELGISPRSVFFDESPIRNHDTSRSTNDFINKLDKDEQELQQLIIDKDEYNTNNENNNNNIEENNNNNNL